jgi:hypothetical protein
MAAAVAGVEVAGVEVAGVEVGGVEVAGAGSRATREAMVWVLLTLIRLGPPVRLVPVARRQ